MEAAILSNSIWWSELWARAHMLRVPKQQLHQDQKTWIIELASCTLEKGITFNHSINLPLWLIPIQLLKTIGRIKLSTEHSLNVFKNSSSQERYVYLLPASDSSNSMEQVASVARLFLSSKSYAAVLIRTMMTLKYDDIHDIQDYPDSKKCLWIQSFYTRWK